MQSNHTIYIGINGIFCEHCVEKIMKALTSLDGVEKVRIEKDIACVEGPSLPPKAVFVRTICDLGYETDEASISQKETIISKRIPLREFLLILAVILIIAFILRQSLGFNIFTVIPTIDSSITYGMLFVTGMLTSIHCVGMCGAINLATVSSDASAGRMKRPVLYNLGRILSYTVCGAAVGALGRVFQLNGILSGAVILLAAVFMILLSLRMLGLIDLRRRKIGLHIPRRTSHAFVIGLLNGLMPCGPLQAVQLYALSTGSVGRGALAMFLFALGTVPLMLFVGSIANVLNAKRRIFINKVSATLILVLAVVMANRGLSILGINTSSLAKLRYKDYQIASLEGDYQTVEFDLTYNGYADILVLAGTPVRLNIKVDPDYLTGCNNEVVSRTFGFDQKLAAGDNMIEFIPEEAGDYTYTCWMHMLSNQIKVIENEDVFVNSNNH